MTKLLKVIFGCLGGISSSVLAQDWPEFHGPNGQGISLATNVPWEWSATKNVAWKTPIPGLGWSSPVLKGRRIFCTTGDQQAGLISLRALAVDAGTGKILWDQEIFREPVDRINGKNSHASPSPVITGDRLFVHFGHQGTACLDLNGQILWRNQELRYPPVHGNGGSPIIAGDLLIFNGDGSEDPFVAALDKLTGRVTWKTPRRVQVGNKFSFSTPQVIVVNGQPQVISPGSGAVCAYDPKSGRELWRVRYGQGYSVVPRPVFGHGLVFIGTGFDAPAVLAIKPDGQGDVTESHVVWSLKRGAPLTPSLLLVGEELYLVSDTGIATCVNAKTGAQYWQERLGGGYSASPVWADGRIYFLSEEGQTTVIKPGKQFTRLAVNALGERALASPAVTTGAIYLRTAQHLFRVGAPAE